MNSGTTIFAQIIHYLSHYDFQQCVGRYNDERKVQSFSCWDQFLCMAFAQLTYRESLRDIEACLRTTRPKLYHMGFRSTVSRNTLANANSVRPWRIWADFAQTLIAEARRLYVDHDFGVDLDGAAYALDATVIDLCLALFPWASFRKRKGAVKMHTLLGVICDQIVSFVVHRSSKDYPERLRRIRDDEGRSFVFLTNNMTLPAEMIARLYKCRWSVELFFKWIKQHLRIKAFYGRSENAVKTQIWIAIGVYVMVAIARKRLHLDRSPYTMLQVLALTLFEKIPIKTALSGVTDNEFDSVNISPYLKQLDLFDFLTGQQCQFL